MTVGGRVAVYGVPYEFRYAHLEIEDAAELALEQSLLREEVI